MSFTLARQMRALSEHEPSLDSGVRLGLGGNMETPNRQRSTAELQEIYENDPAWMLDRALHSPTRAEQDEWLARLRGLGIEVTLKKRRRPVST